MLETFSAMYRFIPWISAVTAIRVVVARMMPSRVRKLRSLFLRSESSAMRAASQKKAAARKCRVGVTEATGQDVRSPRFVPKMGASNCEYAGLAPFGAVNRPDDDG